MFSLSPKVRLRDVGEKTVALDLERGQYFSLNASGRQLLTALLNGENVESIVERYAAQWGVAPAVLASDVDALLNDLLRASLIVEER